MAARPRPARPEPVSIFKNRDEGEKVLRGIGKFTWNMYQKICQEKQGQNIFFSPTSISIALAMTYLGAREETAVQMREVLGFQEVEEEHIHNSFADIVSSLKNPSAKYILHTANKLFGHTGYDFLQEYLEATKSKYVAELEQVNFGDAEAAREKINTWVEEQTAQKITNLIPSGVLNDMVRLVLVNAIYFKGDWTSKFDKDDTQVNDFHLKQEESIKVDMMFQKKSFLFGMSKELKAKAIQLPYVGDELSMVAVLPDENDGLEELEKQLTFDHLNEVRRRFFMRPVEVEVFLPKFKLEQDFSLSDTLSAMGMPHLFDQNNADLSGMDGGKNLFISKVLHKAFIEVNEEGSEAAAATAVVAMLRCAPMAPMKMEFRADHPFLFFIKDNRSGAILFLGKVLKPPTAGSN